MFCSLWQFRIISFTWSDCSCRWGTRAWYCGAMIGHADTTNLKTGCDHEASRKWCHSTHSLSARYVTPYKFSVLLRVYTHWWGIILDKLTSWTGFDWLFGADSHGFCCMLIRNPSGAPLTNPCKIVYNIVEHRLWVHLSFTLVNRCLNRFGGRTCRLCYVAGELIITQPSRPGRARYIIHRRSSE